MEKIEEYLAESVTNIRSDRALALTLLTDILEKIQLAEMHKDLGPVAAKYLETLQRSNEQLVKVSALLQKKISSGKDLSSFDKDEIFKLIQAEPDGNLDG
jgi:hypothetical protein|tara:strand:- start:12425 stop:12724 length:300 start_codon:yes stop_codon:yes gene_type:complete